MTRRGVRGESFGVLRGRSHTVNRPTLLNGCHLDRLRGSLRPEEEWRDPEEVSSAMLMQGVLTKAAGMLSSSFQYA